MKKQIVKISYLAAFVVALLVSGSVMAQNNLTWDNLGSKQVDYALDHDSFKASSNQTYSALKIKVDNGAVNIHKVTVHYANGDHQDVKLSGTLTPGNDGQLIDLKGNQRVIEKVTFWYDTKDGNKTKEKAVVEVWAKK